MRCTNSANYYFCLPANIVINKGLFVSFATSLTPFFAKIRMVYVAVLCSPVALKRVAVLF